MGVLDKFLDVMKLNDEEDYDEEEYYEEDDEYYDDRPAKRSGFLKRNNNYEEEYEDDYYEEAPAPRESKGFLNKVKGGFSRQDRKADRYEEEDRFEREDRFAAPARSSASKPAPRQSGRRTSSSAMEVCVMRPSSVEDSRDIAETLLGNSTVVLNLEGLDIEVAQRIIDFTSGACFALGGNLQKVSQYIFLLTPANVDISGDLNNLFGESARSNSSGRY